MVVTRSQSQILINQFRNLSINQKVKIDATGMNYVISPF